MLKTQLQSPDTVENDRQQGIGNKTTEYSYNYQI
jgi:hypothetical protein